MAGKRGDSCRRTNAAELDAAMLDVWQRGVLSGVTLRNSRPQSSLIREAEIYCVPSVLPIILIPDRQESQHHAHHHKHPTSKALDKKQAFSNDAAFILNREGDNNRMLCGSWPSPGGTVSPGRHVRTLFPPAARCMLPRCGSGDIVCVRSHWILSRMAPWASATAVAASAQYAGDGRRRPGLWNARRR